MPETLVTFYDDEEEEIQQDGIMFPFMNEVQVALHEAKETSYEFNIPIEILPANRVIMFDCFVRFVGANRWKFEIKNDCLYCCCLTSN